MKNLLKKWLGGTATWEEEKQLRRAASQDDFLAEAMDGYDAYPLGDHAAKIRQLKGRIAGQKKHQKNPVFYLTRVAAAAVIIGVIGTFIWVQNEVQSPEVLSMESPKMDSPPLEPKMSPNNPEAVIAADNQRNTTISKPKTSPKPSPKTKSNPEISKPVAPANTPITTKPINEAIVEYEVEETSADIVSTSPTRIIEADPPLPSVTPAVKENTVNKNAEAEEAVRKKRTAAVAKKDRSAEKARQASSRVVTEEAVSLTKMEEKVNTTEIDAKALGSTSNDGVVEKINYYVGAVKNEDGQPMDQVKIVSLNTTNKTITDQTGDFVITSKTPLRKLVVSRDGFHTRNISINQYTDFLNIVLTKKSTSIPGADNYQEAEMIAPRPQKGFVDFFKYLDNNLTYPIQAKTEGVEREVEIRFYIDELGTPTNLKVSIPDKYGFNKEAIRLLESGPKWEPVNTFARYYVTFELE